jgi:transposase
MLPQELVYGGDQTGPNPTDRARRGSKRHLICDGRGVPLAVRLTGANRNDSQEALALVDAIPPLRGARGRPRQRPDFVLGDRGYDAAAIRGGLRTRHIVPLLPIRRTAHRSGLGRWRWVVERTFAQARTSRKHYGVRSKPLARRTLRVSHARAVEYSVGRQEAAATAAECGRDSE